MIIDRELCVGCGECVLTCPVNAILLENEWAEIDRECCVECGNCLRTADCPVDAIDQDDLQWPRLLRKCFSDNQFNWPDHLRYTLSSGRGTEECKTNDRTGKFKKGEVGIIVELGRPNTGTTLADAEKIAQALIGVGARMAGNSPFTGILEDREKGILPKDVKRQRVLSCLIEAKIPLASLENTLLKLREAGHEVDTVFSVGLITRVEDGFSLPVTPVVERLGIPMRAAAKVNVGLGRPLCTD